MSNFVACRNFKLTLISATDVEQVRIFFTTKLYARVSIGKYAMTKQTPTDKDHETNPEWNHTMEYNIAAADVQNPTGLNVEIELYLDRTRGDKRVSFVSRTTNELFCLGLNNMNEGKMTRLTLPLVNDDGVTKGEITFDYMFGEEKNVEKLSLFKKMVNAGTSMAVKAAFMSTTGIYLPTPVRVFDEPEIAKSGSFWNSIISGEGLLDLILEGAQYM